MQVRPKLIIFDIIETVMSLESMRPRFEAAGLPGALLELWFASGLRDAFAIAASGGFRPFPEVLQGVLGQIVDTATDEQARMLVAGMAELRPHDESGPALTLLAKAGFRIAALSNGAAATTRKLLREGGLEPFFEQVGSIEDAGASKPKPEVYHTLLQSCRAAASRRMRPAWSRATPGT
jgi:2-haloacid dehalogenase